MLRTGKPLVERVVAPTTLALPVAKSQVVGRVEVYDGSRLVASSNLVAAESVADAQVSKLATAIGQVKSGLPAAPQQIVLSGHGEFLAREAVHHVASVTSDRAA